MSATFPLSNPGMVNRPPCKYGKDCYQKNPMHHEKFRHPGDKENNDDSNNSNKEQQGNKRTLDAAHKDTESPSKKPKIEEAKVEEVEEATTVDETDKATPKAEEDEKEPEAEAPKDEDKAVDHEPEEPLLPASPTNPRENLKQKFGVEMPEDFYEFWKFCQILNGEHPEDALLAQCGLKLVGPFDVLRGALKESNNRKASDYLCHWRYQFDPPEFQTVLASQETDFHLGYYRDDPAESPAFVASNDPLDGCKLTPLGDNLFGAVYHHLGNLMRGAEPFKQTALQKLKEKIHVQATMKIVDSDFSLDLKTPAMKLRERKKVANTFQGVGLIVPYNKEADVGYREIPETTASLKKIFKNINEAAEGEALDKAMDVLQELVTNVQFANDEGDPGMGIELGLDAFATGGERLHSVIEHLLGVGYELVNRPLYAKIIKAHLKRRRSGQVFKIQ